jgi:hypothetical protein
VVVRREEDVCELEGDSIRRLGDEAEDNNVPTLNECEMCGGKPDSGSVSLLWYAEKSSYHTFGHKGRVEPEHAS